uniref:Uncharacterized protein n=2 Tax=Cryptomonas curvata TaxID=233186 RepID=A0A7S0MZ88_9CRYP|mmetsp:Transcript_5537/g.12309  ORF Transcript_5537/g.12309 Transcript_5537/m.12309 type:complete len:149 (+) Transcript_5537:528-974(+)
MPASKVLLVLNTCSPDSMDPDVPVGSPFFREKFFQRIRQIPGRCIFSSCRMDEPTYTGIFALLFFNALSGVRDESSDVDNQFYAQIAADTNAVFTFNLMDFLRRHMHHVMPKEYKDDVRMHPFLELGQEDNFVIARRTHPAHVMQMRT